MKYRSDFTVHSSYNQIQFNDMSIFQVTLKEELNKTVVQASICQQYNLSNCHMPQLSCIGPNRPPSYKLCHLQYSSQIVHSIFSMYGVRAIQPYGLQFVSTVFASTQNRSKYKTISPSNSLLNEGEGYIPSLKFHPEISLLLLARCYSCFCQMYFLIQKLSV